MRTQKTVSTRPGEVSGGAGPTHGGPPASSPQPGGKHTAAVGAWVCALLTTAQADGHVPPCQLPQTSAWLPVPPPPVLVQR